MTESEFKHFFEILTTPKYTNYFSPVRRCNMKSLLLSLLLVVGNWPQFLGPSGDGQVPPECNPPIVWSETENVVWKTPIHGRGWSSPVIWNDQIWLTTATEDGTELFAVCIDKESGEIVRDIKVFDIPEPQKRNGVNSYASPTPIVEEGRLYVFFGYAGLAALDTRSGEILWSRSDFVCDHHNNGPGSSPVPYKNLLIFHVDGLDVQYIVAVDKETGATAWKTDRSFDYESVVDDKRKAYATPLIVSHEGKDYLLSGAAQAAFAYDPATGKELWRFLYDGGFSNASKPVVWNGFAILNRGFEKTKLYAVPLESEGDIPDEAIRWEFGKNAPQAETPVVFNDHLFFCDVFGSGTCLNLDDASIGWTYRFGGNYWASPLLVRDRIYFFNEQGEATVIDANDREECKVLRKNSLEDGCMATPAVSGNALFVRTKTHLYRIEER